jgi:hypothetical protein
MNPPESKLRLHFFIISTPHPSKLWYTTRRAPNGADVSGNCFDHYRSMPDGNQVGFFCCQTRRFRKEAPEKAWQWDRGK